LVVDFADFINTFKNFLYKKGFLKCIFNKKGFSLIKNVFQSKIVLFSFVFSCFTLNKAAIFYVIIPEELKDSDR